MRGNFSVMMSAAAAALLIGGSPALAQSQIDDPRLSPMLFGPTEKEQREKMRKEREEREEALLISQEQDRDAQQIDDPKMRPLVFGPSRPEYEDDLSGGRITLGEKDDNRGFFGVLTFLAPDETNLSLGVGPVFKPDYYGSDDYEVFLTTTARTSPFLVSPVSGSVLRCASRVAATRTITRRSSALAM